jgi:peptidoglycan hydrolase-like protein with peptidoglycan-binding domain
MPAALVALAAAGLLSPSAGLGANAGGTSPGGSPAATTAPGATAPTAPRSTAGAHITDVRCVPSNACSGNPHQVSIRGRLAFRGPGLAAGMAVAFPVSAGAHISRRSPTSRLRFTSLGLVASVPSSAHSGHIEVLLSSGHATAPFGPILVARHALHPPHTPHKVTSLTPGAQTGSVSASAFDGQGMWIWYVSKSDGGSVPSIVAQAQQAGIKTLFIKSSDGGSNYWAQFSSALVGQLHASGLKVCAWQYVYGTHPTAEADLGAQAVAAGADCLVIDAEAEYEGHYGAAQTYMTELRAKIGANYPVGLASFPYVDYHPSLPYSVFLGPGGAQFNAPQMYWQEIGTTVDNVYAHTFLHNRIYGRPIYPLGQSYNDPPPANLERFRQLAGAYGSTGLSWWDWQETTARGWAALAANLAPLSSFTPTAGEVVLTQGAKGDEVLWMQEHLAAAIPSQPTTGTFASTTEANLQSFQSQKGLPVTGQTDAATWQALLALTPVAVDWTGGGPSASASSARVRPGAVRVARAPESARLHAVRYEIRRHGGSPARG